MRGAGMVLACMRYAALRERARAREGVRVDIFSLAYFQWMTVRYMLTPARGCKGRYIFITYIFTTMRWNKGELRKKKGKRAALPRRGTGRAAARERSGSGPVHAAGHFCSVRALLLRRRSGQEEHAAGHAPAPVRCTPQATLQVCSVCLNLTASVY